MAITMSSKTISLHQTGDWPQQEDANSTLHRRSSACISESSCPNAYRRNDLQTAHSTIALQVKNSSFTSCRHDLYSMVHDDHSKSTACIPCCFACVVSTAHMNSRSRADTCHKIVRHKRPHTCLQQEPPAPQSKTPHCGRHPCPWDNRLCPLHELPPEHIQAETSKSAISHLCSLDCI